jgi:hypothetical protein
MLGIKYNHIYSKTDTYKIIMYICYVTTLYCYEYIRVRKDGLVLIYNTFAYTYGYLFCKDADEKRLQETKQ